jgi:hypothetical protein
MASALTHSTKYAVGRDHSEGTSALTNNCQCILIKPLRSP